MANTTAAQGFRINDRVGYMDHQRGILREASVKEISATGALRLQEVGGPRIPWWITPATALEWAHAEALS